ncbi:MAG: hypothetical protein FWE18_03675 [Alphaproteobacteria bacterium]|nr:hypothetical protein [Alphaproteobacteria bacterium]
MFVDKKIFIIAIFFIFPSFVWAYGEYTSEDIHSYGIDYDMTLLKKILNNDLEIAKEIRKQGIEQGRDIHVRKNKLGELYLEENGELLGKYQVFNKQGLSQFDMAHYYWLTWIIIISTSFAYYRIVFENKKTKKGTKVLLSLLVFSIVPPLIVSPFYENTGEIFGWIFGIFFFGIFILFFAKMLLFIFNKMF